MLRKSSMFLLLATVFSMVLIIPNSYAQETDDVVQEITVGTTALFVELSGDNVSMLQILLMEPL